MINQRFIGFRYPSTKGFSLAWLIAFMKSFASLVCRVIATLSTRQTLACSLGFCSFLPIRTVIRAACLLQLYQTHKTHRVCLVFSPTVS